MGSDESRQADTALERLTSPVEAVTILHLQFNDAMRNLWTAKNPFMSAWLSAANKVTTTARGQATAAGKREVAAIQAETSKQIVDF